MTRPPIAPLEQPPASSGTTPVGSRAPALTDAYRPIRRVEPPLSPVAGVLAAAGDRRVVLADAVEARDRVFCVRPDPPQHLLAPCDVVRRGDGHDLELPWCREPLARLLAARAAGGAPLAGGELVTLVVSLLRGVREAWADQAPESEGPRGTWWIDDGGRPLFAPGSDDAEPVASAADAVIAQAAEHTRDRVLVRLLEEGRSALQRPRALARALPQLEDALFEACAPRAIERAEERAGGPRVAAPRTAVELRPAGSGIPGLIERFGDAGIADAVGDALDRTRAALRSRLAGGRRAPLLAGGVVAALVLGGGLLWPAEPEPAAARGASERSPAAAPGPSPDASPASSEEPVAGAPAPEDPAAAAERLLDELAECVAHGDPLCAGIRDAGAEPLPPEALETAAGATQLALLDDYGDVAVLRADDPAGERGSLLLQLVRLDGRWLLRTATPMAAG
ncbi:hypothetical protein B5M43_000840 [Microbacterium sp. MEC084]|uniref:hypothetical protein n=1 Tax=Microbacterium sp. MEC084 TaxID=1963027 RepID=UPI00106FC347|nr:hypothetical protein [Microbacterium sp. MEC084]MCD1267402.1 hypothetical protein [Microbacterium sp. MEC084]